MPFPPKKPAPASSSKKGNPWSSQNKAKKKPATKGPAPAWQGVADKMLGSKC